MQLHFVSIVPPSSVSKRSKAAFIYMTYYNVTPDLTNKEGLNFIEVFTIGVILDGDCLDLFIRYLYL
jgi:hypothetical protein